MGLYGYRLDTTPRLNTLASKGVVFEDAFSCINMTDPSLTSIFSGLYPRTHGIINHGPSVTEDEENLLEARNVALLPEILKSRGYKTFAIDWLARWHKRGYDHYIDMFSRYQGRQDKFTRSLYPKLPMFIQKMARWGLVVKRKLIPEGYTSSNEAKMITDKAIEILKDNKEGTFLFAHYWDVHTPYTPPVKFQFSPDLYSDTRDVASVVKSFHPSLTSRTLKSFSWKMKTKNINEIQALYDGGIRHVDYYAGKLIQFALDNLEDPLIVFTSDHGESLGEHNIYFDHHGLYDTSIRVPLLMWSHGLEGRVKGLVQHVDIVPTLLDILGIPSKNVDGMSLLPMTKGGSGRESIFVEESQAQHKIAVRTETHKYIRSFSDTCKYCNVPHGDREELYDLEKDPSEEKNVIENKELVTRLREELEKWENIFKNRVHG